MGACRWKIKVKARHASAKRLGSSAAGARDDLSYIRPKLLLLQKRAGRIAAQSPGPARTPRGRRRCSGGRTPAPASPPALAAGAELGCPLRAAAQRSGLPRRTPRGLGSTARRPAATGRVQAPRPCRARARVRKKIREIERKTRLPGKKKEKTSAMQKKERERARARANERASGRRGLGQREKRLASTSHAGVELTGWGRARSCAARPTAAAAAPAAATPTSHLWDYPAKRFAPPRKRQHRRERRRKQLPAVLPHRLAGARSVWRESPTNGRGAPGPTAVGLNGSGFTGG
jgi:hypothetical protein